MDLWKLKATLELDNTDYLSKVESAKKDAEEIAKSWDSSEQAVSAPSVTPATSAMEVTKGILASDLIRNVLDATKDLAVESVGLASNLSEVQNVVDTTFGDGAIVIDSWAQTTNEAFGISEYNAKLFSGTMGAMLKSMGLAPEEAMEMSMSMTELAGDIASFYNLDHEDAFVKIRSGLAGEVEPLRQLGINLSVANMEAHAMTLGITKQWEEMTEAEKAVIRYSALLSQTTDAQGDFARTSDSLANATRTLGNNMDAAKAKFGESLLPIAEGFVNTLNDAFKNLNTQSVEERISAIGESSLTSLENVEYTAERAQNIISVLSGFSDASARTEAEQAQWLALINQLTEQIPTLGEMINLTTGEINGGTEALAQHVNEWEAAANLTIGESKYTATEDIVTGLESQIAAEETALENSRKLMQIAGTDAQLIGSQVAAELGKTFDGTNESFIEMMSTVEGYQTALKLGFTDLDITEATTPYYEQVEEEEKALERIAELETDLETAKSALETAQSELTAGADELVMSVDASMQDAKEATDEAVDNLDQSPEARANAKATGDAATAGLAAAYPAFDSEVSKWTSRAGDIGTAVGSAISGIGNGTDGTHAVGLDYVPYNNYAANLHRGEAVLTRSEAEEWRSGKMQRPNITVIQNIYSEAKTAADLMEEARWAQERAVLGYV